MDVVMQHVSCLINGFYDVGSSPANAVDAERTKGVSYLEKDHGIWRQTLNGPQGPSRDNPDVFRVSCGPSNPGLGSSPKLQVSTLVTG